MTESNPTTAVTEQDTNTALAKINNETAALAVQKTTTAGPLAKTAQASPATAGGTEAATLEVPPISNEDATEDAAPKSAAPQPAAPEMAPARAWNPTKKATPRQRRRRIRLILLAVLAALYGLGIWHFSSHFVPGTTVDGIDASNMATSELAGALADRAATYQLTVTDPNGFEATFKGSDFAFSSDADAVAREALSRTTPALWLPYLLSPQHMLVDAQIGFDEEALHSLVNTAVEAYNAEAEPPTNAKASYNKDEGHFVIADESCGTALDAGKIYDACVPACRELALATSVGPEALLQPPITKLNTDLLAVVEHVNQVLDTPIDMTCAGETICTIDRDTVASWITITDDNQLKVEGVYDWVEHNDAIKDAGNSSDDEHVWELDVQGTTDSIHYVIENNLGMSVEVVRTLIESKPPVTPGAKERGRHIDVNLTTQFARFYDTDGTVIWDSPFVSGNVAEGRDTPTGEFAIESKEAGRTLVGADEDQDGKPDYESYVNFWMPFLRGDWGLHDATWRWDSEFGGDTYTYNGSHGCINLPYDKAEALFNLCVVGDPVIVHY